MIKSKLSLFWVAFLAVGTVSLFASTHADTETVRNIASALRQNENDAALNLLKPALIAFPGDAKLWTMQGFVLNKLHRANDALSAYQHALSISPNNIGALEGAAQIEYERDSKNALPFLERILKLRPEDATSHAMMGSLAYKQGDCSAAEKNFALSGKLLASQPVALAQYGSCLVKLGQPDQAMPIFQKLLELTPDDADTRIRLASLQLKLNVPKEAIATLQPLLEGKPDSRMSELAAAGYEADGQTQEAANTLNRAVRADPRNVDLYIDLATLAFDHHSFASGIELMTSGLQFVPDSAVLYLERGILYVQIADYEKADADFEKASELDPNQSFSQVAQGKVAEQHGDYATALAAVQKKLARKPDDPFLLYTQAEILAQKWLEPGTPQFKLAVESARRAAAAKPDMIAAHDILGTLYLRSGEYPLAIQQSREVLRLEPKDEAALYRLMMALRKTGDRKELPALLQQLAQLHQEKAKARSFQHREE
ncbi:MAG TPA: tetratricopeptide repeat protein [Terriglobales bacterium]|jgi:tetratricopeptide (TPR) repeat protein|nr:tetratricopeptide repeat protein [Terriglobales bacterium]